MCEIYFHFSHSSSGKHDYEHVNDTRISVPTEPWAPLFLTGRHRVQRKRPLRATIQQHEHDLLNPANFRHGISCWVLPCGPTVHNQLNWLDGCCSPQLLWFAFRSKLLFASFCTTQALSLRRHAVARLLPLHYHTHVLDRVGPSKFSQTPEAFFNAEILSKEAIAGWMGLKQAWEHSNCKFIPTRLFHIILIQSNDFN